MQFSPLWYYEDVYLFFHACIIIRSILGDTGKDKYSHDGIGGLHGMVFREFMETAWESTGRNSVVRSMISIDD